MNEKIEGNMGYKKIDNEILKKLHEVEMEILDEINRICMQNDINYFLMGGSMLGAVRHKGFIPWDDDIDIAMPRKDYNKFIKICQTELNPKYYLHCYETDRKYYLPFAKIRKNDTIFLEEAVKDVDTHHGIFVDIFPFENAKKADSFFQKIQAILVRTITEVMLYKKKIIKRKSCRHPFVAIILKIFPGAFLMRLQKTLMCLNQNDNADYLVALSGSCEYRRATSLKSVFLPTKPIQFENRVYQGMNNPDAYLKSVFGDYMKLPPEEERVNHNAIKIVFEKIQQDK